MKKALITGITGQDGSYLAELLLEKGYEVHGIVRRASVSTTARIDHIMDKLVIHEGDLSDSSSIIRIVLQVKPDEIYNLAAQSHVQVSFDAAEYTGDVDALGVLRILEAVHTAGLDKTCRIYQASTSELYGKVEECPQNEDTPFHPYISAIACMIFIVLYRLCRRSKTLQNLICNICNGFYRICQCSIQIKNTSFIHFCPLPFNPICHCFVLSVFFRQHSQISYIILPVTA